MSEVGVKPVFVFVTLLLFLWSCKFTSRANTEPRSIPSDFVALIQLDGTILEDIRYFTAHNFIGTPIRGYRSPKCLLTRQAAEGVVAAQRDANAAGMSLKVYDCYRPQRAVDHFVEWADSADESMKTEFYPYVKKRDLFGPYIATRSGHSRGSTLDLTLVKLPAKEQPPFDPAHQVECTKGASERYKDNTIEMGTGFDCFDPHAHTDTTSADVSQAAHKNRDLLRSIMQKHGFKNLPEEWWHYTLQNEPYPNTYFDFEVQ